MEEALLPVPEENPGVTVTTRKLCESNKRHKYQVTHSNRDRRDRYLKDLFHTLLNLPTGRFLVIFLGSYLALYSLFALLYMQSVSKHCVSNITSFTHALWFSVHTSCVTCSLSHTQTSWDALADFLVSHLPAVCSHWPVQRLATATRRPIRIVPLSI